MLGSQKSSQEMAPVRPVERHLIAATKPPLSCLLIDDNQFDCLRLSRDLKKLENPTELTTATTVEDAYEKLAARRYGLLLVDYYLPDGDGLEIANWLLAGASPNANTPRILLTGEDDPKVHQRARLLGYSTCLSKHLLSLPRLETAVAEATCEYAGQSS